MNLEQQTAVLNRNRDTIRGLRDEIERMKQKQAQFHLQEAAQQQENIATKLNSILLVLNAEELGQGMRGDKQSALGQETVGLFAELKETYEQINALLTALPALQEQVTQWKKEVDEQVALFDKLSAKGPK